MAPRARPVGKGQIVSPLRSDSESPPPSRRRSDTLPDVNERSGDELSDSVIPPTRGYDRGRQSQVVRSSTDYKSQGRTPRSRPLRRSPDDSEDEEGGYGTQAIRSSHPLTTSRTSASKRERLRRNDSEDSDGERVPIVRSERAVLKPVSTPKRARTPDVDKAYLSPPPTARKPLRVPDTPRGRVPRRSSGHVPRTRRHSPEYGHDVYDVLSSDNDAVVRVRSKPKKSVPSEDVLDISTSDEFPTRISPRKLKFSDGTQDNHADNHSQSEAVVDLDDDDDVDEDGNLRGFVVPDDDDVLNRKKSVHESSKALPRKYEEDVSEQGERAPKGGERKGSRSSRSDLAANARMYENGSEADEGEYEVTRNISAKPEGVSRTAGTSITAATNDGMKVDLNFRGRTRAYEHSKRKARSLSRDSDDFRPAPKRSSRIAGGRRSDVERNVRRTSRRSATPSEDGRREPVRRIKDTPTRSGRSPSPVKRKRRDRSPTPYDSDDAKSAKRSKKQQSARAHRSPSPPATNTRTKRKDRSPTPSDGDDRKQVRRGKLASAPAAPVKSERSSTKQVALGNTSATRPLVKDKKCKITFENDHDGFLVGTYEDCVAYLSSNMLRTPQQTGAVGVSHFGNTHNGLPMFEDDNIHIKRLRAIITCVSAAGGQVLNPARADSEESRVGLTSFTTKFNKTIQTATRDGDNVGLFIFGFIAPDGSFLERLAVPAGDNPNNQAFHALNIFPLNGDYQRTLAFLHRVFAPANQQCQMFTPDNAWIAGTLWADRDKYQNKKPLPVHVVTNPGEAASPRSRGVHPSLHRTSRNYLSDIPIFDSRRHFMASHVGEDWEEGFSPEKILTQVDGLDDRFKGEIPDDSFVAMHCVASMRSNGVVSLNLIGAQVLVTPRVVHFSDL